MDAASEHLDFERAAELRDALMHSQHLEEPTVVLEVEGGDRDVVGYARDGDDACVAILRIRGGKLLARDHRLLENIEDEPDADVLRRISARTYVGATGTGGGVARSVRFRRPRALGGSRSGDTRARSPARARARADRSRRAERAPPARGVQAGGSRDRRAGGRSGVRSAARTRACTSAAHPRLLRHVARAGDATTSRSLVWFENGRPKRGPNIASSRVATVHGHRRFRVDGRGRHALLPAASRRERSRFPISSWSTAGRDSSARREMRSSALGLMSLPLISLAKREEEIFVIGQLASRCASRGARRRLDCCSRRATKRTASPSPLIGSAELRTVTSELLKIPGIGPVKRRQLLAAFGSVQGVRDASPEQIIGAARLVAGHRPSGAQLASPLIRDHFAHGGIMTIGILDPFSGIAGDMTLGALVDCGLDPAWLLALPARLGLDGVERADPGRVPRTARLQESRLRHPTAAARAASARDPVDRGAQRGAAGRCGPAPTRRSLRSRRSRARCTAIARSRSTSTKWVRSTPSSMSLGSIWGFAHAGRRDRVLRSRRARRRDRRVGPWHASGARAGDAEIARGATPSAPGLPARASW